MNEKVVKPATLVKEELTKELVDKINSSQLPMFIIEYIIRDILNEVRIAASKQLQEDSKKYEQQLELHNDDKLQED